MSGLARAAKKHWKRKVKLFKKYWKIVAIAVVAYFTFGLALGAMAPAAGTVAAGSTAATAGAGVMTATGVAAGSTAAAATTAATVAGIETVTVTAAAGGFSAAAGGAAAAAAGGAAAANMAGKPTGDAPSQQPVKPAQAVQPEAAATQPTSMMAKAKGAWKDMSFADKLLLAKSGVDVVSAATGPSPEEEAAAAAKWQGAFYGFDAKGADQFVKQQGQATKVQQPTAPGQARQIVPGAEGPPAGSEQSSVNPMQNQQRMQFQSTAEQPEQAPVPEAEQVTNQGGNRDLFAQRAKGVRYLV